MTETPTNESSLLLSLNELMGIEKERVDTEHEQQRRADWKAERAKAETIAKAKAAEQVRIRTEQLRRNEARIRHKEDLARSHATQEAELERARIEALRRDELVLKKATWEYELKVKTLEQSDARKQLQVTRIAAAALLSLAAVGCGLLLNDLSTEHQSERYALQTDVTNRDGKLSVLKRANETQLTKIHALQTELDVATKRAEKAEKNAEELAKATPSTPPPIPIPHFGIPSRSLPTPKTADPFSIADCKPGDPDPACGNLGL